MSEETRLLLPDVDWRRVTRLRIVLAHHYHRVDPDLVWTYSAEDAPRLAEVVAAFLECLSP